MEVKEATTEEDPTLMRLKGIFWGGQSPPAAHQSLFDDPSDTNVDDLGGIGYHTALELALVVLPLLLPLLLSRPCLEGSFNVKFAH